MVSSRQQPAGPGDLLLGRRAGEQLVEQLVADPPIGRHPESLPDPAAVSGPLDRLIDQLGEHCRGVPGGRAAPRLPSADPSSLYELAGLVAGQPRRDPQPESLKLRARASSSVVALPFCVLLLVVVGIAISFVHAYTVPRTGRLGTSWAPSTQCVECVSVLEGCGHGIGAARVLTVAKVTKTAAGGYAEYLDAKSQPSQLGDYYLKDGERAEAPGRWAGGADLFGLDPEQPVTGEQLRTLMDVRRPDTGAELRRVGGSGEAVAAIDATFSAPKSVSAAWALARPELREQIEAAHEIAIDRALAYAVRQVPMLRRRVSGDTVVHEKAVGVVATSWRHTTARAVDQQVPDPAAALPRPAAWGRPPRPASGGDRLPVVAGAPARGRRRLPHRTRPRTHPPRIQHHPRDRSWATLLRARRHPAAADRPLVKPPPPSPSSDPRPPRRPTTTRWKRSSPRADPSAVDADQQARAAAQDRTAVAQAGTNDSDPDPQRQDAA